MHRLSSHVVLAAVVAAVIAPPLHAADPAAVIVTATRQPTRASELLSDVSVIEKDEIERAGQTNLAEFLARQPGIEYTTNGSPGAATNVFIRGNSSGQTLVLVDGQRIGSATLGSVSWSRIPLSQIERIEILRGPASSLYGSDAIGGVVQIFTRRGDGPARFNAEAGVGSRGTQSGSVGVSGGADGWRYSFNASSLRTDGFNSIANPRHSSYNTDSDGFHNDSAVAALSFAPARGHEAGVNFFYSSGRNKYDSGSSAAAAAKQYENSLTVQNLGAYLRNALSEGWTSTLRIGKSIDDSTNYTNGAKSSLFRTDQDQISWQNDVRLAAGSLLLAVEDLKQRIGGTTAYTLKEREIKSVLGGWNTRLGNHRLQANLRRDDNSQFGARNTGALAYGYQIDAVWRAHASYGTAFRAPTFNDLYYPLTGGYQGNPDLRPEFARNREVAINYERGAHQASATYYLNRVNDLISWSGLFVPVNIGTARIAGLTFAYTGALGGHDVAASADFMDPRDAATDKLLARHARHRASVSVGRAYGAWELRTEIQTVGMRYNEDANTRRLGGYSIVNLQASRALGGDWSLFGRVNNIFGKRYEVTADFATPRVDLFVGLRYAPR